MPDLDLVAPELTVLDAVGDAWSVPRHGLRLAAVRAGAARLRERMLAEAPAVCVRTLPISTLLYPTRYAFWAAALSPAPYVTMTHRALLVQFRQGGAVRNLLFNPTDPERARRAPFFETLVRRFGETAARYLAKRYDDLEVQLARLGLAPEDVDYVAFDHFHTQDLRGLLGTVDGTLRPRFPRAKLLAPRVEWDDWDELHPMQRAWFVPDGRQGVLEDRVVFTRHDLLLGEGVMLVRTPGHTSGNQTLFVKTDRGVWGVSENGTCADSWSPRASRVAGVAAVARHQDLDVVLNGNTVEGGADQYSSMILEKTVVDPVANNTDFVQMFPSSEVTPGVMAPGLSPTYLHGSITHGEVIAQGARKDPEASATRGFGALGS